MNTQLRTRQFLVSRMAQLIAPDERSGRARAAQLAGVSLDTLNKACTERDLTMEAASSLIHGVGKLTGNFELDEIVNEYSRYFVPPRRKLVFQELIDQYAEQIGRSQAFLEALQNGGRVRPVIITEQCRECDTPIELIKICPSCARRR